MASSLALPTAMDGSVGPERAVVAGAGEGVEGTFVAEVEVEGAGAAGVCAAVGAGVEGPEEATAALGYVESACQSGRKFQWRGWKRTF